MQEHIASPAKKQFYVNRMFATIAPRYDLVTTLLSYGQDQRWKRKLVALAGEAEESHPPTVGDPARAAYFSRGAPLGLSRRSRSTGSRSGTSAGTSIDVTGWRIDAGQAVFRAADHDNTEKTVFRQRGRFGGDDIVSSYG